MDVMEKLRLNQSQPTGLWGLGLVFGSTNEGGKIVPSFILNNLRGKSDKTEARLDIKPNTGNLGLTFAHHYPQYQRDEYDAEYSYHVVKDEIDLNHLATTYGAAFTLKSIDGKHTYQLGRDVRINSPLVDRASLPLIAQGILTTEKFYLAHTFINDSRDKKISPTSGSVLTVRNELALGSDTRFHKIELRNTKYYNIVKDVVLELTGQAGIMLNWAWSRVPINDRYRANYIRGFKSAGVRQPQADHNLDAPGDNIGSMSLANWEAKVHFNDVPVLSKYNISPFIYANVICVDPLELRTMKNLKESVRSAFGLGIGWSSQFGRVEAVYTSKTIHHTGDIPAEFQVLFSS